MSISFLLKTTYSDHKRVEESWIFTGKVFPLKICEKQSDEVLLYDLSGFFPTNFTHLS